MTYFAQKTLAKLVEAWHDQNNNSSKTCATATAEKSIVENCFQDSLPRCKVNNIQIL